MTRPLFFLLLLTLVAPNISWAQKDSVKKNQDLDPVVISGSKFSEKKKNVAQG